MKKNLFYLICLSALLCLFAACSKDNGQRNVSTGSHHHIGVHLANDLLRMGQGLDQLVRQR